MAVTMESATFMGKNFQDNQNSIVNTTDLTLKQMFGISSKLVGEQDEISNLETIRWEKHSWKYLSLIGDERVINLQRAKVYVFSDSVLCLGKIHQHPNANESCKNRIEWITTSQSHRDYDGISGESTEFEWNIFPGFTTLQLYGKVTDLLELQRIESWEDVAVANMCEEYESRHDRSGQPDSDGTINCAQCNQDRGSFGK